MKERIGEFLVDKGVLTPEEVQQIVTYAQNAKLKFGQAALDLGILKNDRPLPRSNVDFFHLDVKYFPDATKELFPVSFLLQHGILPLGFKRKGFFLKPRQQLNLGFLQPDEKGHAKAVESAVKGLLGSKFGGVKRYLILADQFLEVLDTIYGMDTPALEKLPRASLDATLADFLSQKPQS